MKKITISGNEIAIDQTRIGIGMSYETASTALAEVIYTGELSDSDGVGFLMVKSAECYGVNGDLVVRFLNGVVSEIVIEADLSTYGQVTPEETLTEMVRRIGEQTIRLLRRNFGWEFFQSYADRLIFRIGEVEVQTSYSPEEDGFALQIRAAGATRDGMAVIGGAAYAPKRLVEEGLKVGYCYRDVSDRPDVSGWCFFTGEETDEEVNDPESIGVYDIQTIVQIDPRILPLLANRPGVAFERTDKTGRFIPV